MLQAIASRAMGNEGRARVGARRAAGFALALAFGGSDRLDAYDLLRRAADTPELSDAVRQAAARLAARVTPDHRLPHTEDPMQDARIILEALGHGFGPLADARVDGFADAT